MDVLGHEIIDHRAEIERPFKKKFLCKRGLCLGQFPVIMIQRRTANFAAGNEPVTPCREFGKHCLHACNNLLQFVGLSFVQPEDVQHPGILIPDACQVM